MSSQHAKTKKIWPAVSQKKIAQSGIRTCDKNDRVFNNILRSTEQSHPILRLSQNNRLSCAPQDLSASVARTDTGSRAE